MGLIRRFVAALSGTSTSPLRDLLTLLAERIAAGDGSGTLPLTPREKATYDRVMDALNRLPRPLMALGTLAIFAAALVNPDWFAGRMDALSAMPEGLWWLIGAVISLYFGARLQTVEQDFQREIVDTIVRLPDPAPPTQAITPRVAETGTDAALTLQAASSSDNPALSDWLGLTEARRVSKA